MQAEKETLEQAIAHLTQQREALENQSQAAIGNPFAAQLITMMKESIDLRIAQLNDNVEQTGHFESTIVG